MKVSRLLFIPILLTLSGCASKQLVKVKDEQQFEKTDLVQVQPKQKEFKNPLQGQWHVTQQNPVAVIVGKIDGIDTLDEKKLFRLSSVRQGSFDGEYEVIADGKPLRGRYTEGSSVLVEAKSLAIRYVTGDKKSGRWEVLGEPETETITVSSATPSASVSHATTLGRFTDEKLMVVGFFNNLGKKVSCDVVYGRFKIDNKPVEFNNKEVLFGLENSVIVKGKEMGGTLEYLNCTGEFEPSFSLQIEGK